MFVRTDEWLPVVFDGKDGKVHDDIMEAACSACAGLQEELMQYSPTSVQLGLLVGLGCASMIQY